MEESDIDILDTVKSLIEGCEDFVVEQISQCRQETTRTTKLEISKNSQKNEENLKNINEKCTTLETVIKEVKDEMKTTTAKTDQKRKELESVIDESITKRLRAMESILDKKDMEISNLKKEIHQLKRNCKCKELFTAYVNAGQNIMHQPCEDDKVTESLDVSSILHDESDILFVTEAFSLTTADLIAPIPGPSHAHSRTINHEDQVIPVTPEPQVNSNSKIITSLQELPENLRCGVANHVKDSPYSTKEKLSKLQVAYIRNYLHELSTTARRKPSVVAKTLLDQGVKDKIWSNMFIPEGVKNFPNYLVTRVKNELSHIKALELATFAETQQQRLNNNSQ